MLLLITRDAPGACHTERSLPTLPNRRQRWLFSNVYVYFFGRNLRVPQCVFALILQLNMPQGVPLAPHFVFPQFPHRERSPVPQEARYETCLRETPAGLLPGLPGHCRIESFL